MTFFFQAEWLANFAVAVSELPPSKDNTPNNNPDFPICHQHGGYPNHKVTVNCEPVPRRGRYVSVYIATPATPLVLCEVEVYAAQRKYYQPIYNYKLP